MPKPLQNSETINLGHGIRQEVPGGVFKVVKRVPKDVVGLLRPGRPGTTFGPSVKESTKTSDVGKALQRGLEVIRRWENEFAVALGALDDLPENVACDSIERWRQQRISMVQSVGLTKTEANAIGLQVTYSVLAVAAEKLAPHGPVDLTGDMATPRPIQMAQRLEEAANKYFDAYPNAPREPYVLPGTVMLLDRLARAVTDSDKWVHIPTFDEEMQSAVRQSGARGRVPLTRTVRARFASAWQAVAQTEETERLKAAKRLAAAEAEAAVATNLQPNPAPPLYEVRDTDVSVGELVDLYRADRTKVDGPEVVGKRYNHVFRAFQEVLGKGTPVRSVTRKEARKVRDLLIEAPTHASKKFPGLSLTEAVEKAKQLDREQEDDDLTIDRMAPATVTAYMDKLNGMMAWAEDEGLVDTNVAKGLGIGNEPRQTRRAFALEELARIFRSLKDERDADTWKFWLPAMLCFTGARAGEIAQLSTNDLMEEGGVPYLVISSHDAETGKRSAAKRLKTKHSNRIIPLHQQLVDQGVVEFIRSRPGPDLFHDLPRTANLVRSHRASRWFGEHLDRLGMTSPAICLHSFRHGLRDAAREIEMPDSNVRALGGWSAQSASEVYGSASALPFVNRDMQRLRWGGFDLNAALNGQPQPETNWSPPS